MSMLTPRGRDIETGRCCRWEAGAVASEGPACGDLIISRNRSDVFRMAGMPRASLENSCPNIGMEVAQ
jgi:hypothetical protein